ncbi:MAG: sulfatase [Verrucomicrobiota bacterium]
MRMVFSFLVAMVLGVGGSYGEEGGRCNVVLIFVDDLGYGDLGCYGNEVIQTPNLDRMAAEGQRWTSFYSSGATCVPSRTGLMSGRHPNLIGKEKLRADREALMPAMMKRQGYATAILGKWHLAGYPEDFTQDEMHPLECGFDYHFGTPGSNDVPAPPGRRQTRDLFDECGPTTFQVPLIRGREVVEFPVNQELLTKQYTEEAVKWIGENKDQRFFLYLAHNMPHAPVFASEEFQGRSGAGVYGDVIEEIDWSVGQVMEALETAGIAEETLVVFTSDNGPWTMFGPHGGTAEPLRGEKGTSWEGGFRVPGIFWWPGTIAPGEVDGIGANLDLYATFASLAGGADLPDDKAGYKSTDLSGVLLREEASPRTQWLFGTSAFRSGKHKIHLSTKERSSNPDTRQREPVEEHDPPLLFDLEADVSETRDVGGEKPEVVERLLGEMREFRK